VNDCCQYLQSAHRERVAEGRVRDFQRREDPSSALRGTFSRWEKARTTAFPGFRVAYCAGISTKQPLVADFIFKAVSSPNSMARAFACCALS
jgi:hypothetical protein